MAINDLFRKASANNTRAVPSNLASPKANGSNTAELTVSTGWPTDTQVDVVICSVNLSQTDSNGNYVKIGGSQTDWVADLTGTTLSNMTLEGGTEPATGYAAGSGTVVTVRPTAAWANSLIDGIRGFANDDGSLKASAIQSALGIGNASSTGFTPFGATMVYTGNNGNKEYTATIAADVTGYLPLGAKIAVTRGTAAPTQCMSFSAASTQYASKTASLTGFSGITNSVTVSDWIYVNSYGGTGYQTIKAYASGTHATNGFKFALNPNGQIDFAAYASSGNSRTVTSYQSVPLKRWVHVAASINMSTGTGAIYLNGALISSNFVTSGTATTMAPATGYYIGRSLFGEYFDGYISEDVTFSNIQAQSQIQANMNISLTGSETGIVALFQGNGANGFNDKTSNANNLTATNGASSTQSANPMNTIEYATVIKIGAYSGGVTPLTLSTGDTCNIPNMTLTGAQYSIAGTPLGIPNDLATTVGRRLLFIPIKASQSTSSTSAVQFPPVKDITFTVPGNCSSITLNTYCDSVGSSGTAVMHFYNGSISGGFLLNQINITTSNSTLSTRAVISVTPGSTITLNADFLSSSGTFSWGTSNAADSGVWIEAV